MAFDTRRSHTKAGRYEKRSLRIFSTSDVKNLPNSQKLLVIREFCINNNQDLLSTAYIRIYISIYT
ncbi:MULTISPECIES: hypothetical protein [Calothrix]|uniref:Transposase n=2 Tax=Calothrix TaxID=1186 RepID=A0ABR8AAN6_9CYAN|nr:MULTISPECIES: hypothetical protein [Calothrix]MBD2195832.1 hypothetical protein [Calothrix parietina FACHB-288]MBD2226419.1 hypothetical protein [Calothrix anomala FACHB-343]